MWVKLKVAHEPGAGKFKKNSNDEPGSLGAITCADQNQMGEQTAVSQNKVNTNVAYV